MRQITDQKTCESKRCIKPKESDNHKVLILIMGPVRVYDVSQLYCMFNLKCIEMHIQCSAIVLLSVYFGVIDGTFRYEKNKA